MKSETLPPARQVVARTSDLEEAEGSDVFLCEYEYDDRWKVRLARRLGTPWRSGTGIKNPKNPKKNLKP